MCVGVGRGWCSSGCKLLLHSAESLSNSNISADFNNILEYFRMTISQVNSLQFHITLWLITVSHFPVCKKRQAGDTPTNFPSPCLRVRLPFLKKIFQKLREVITSSNITVLTRSYPRTLRISFLVTTCMHMHTHTDIHSCDERKMYITKCTISECEGIT